MGRTKILKHLEPFIKHVPENYSVHFLFVLTYNVFYFQKVQCNVNVLELKCLGSLVGVSRMDLVRNEGCVGELE